MLTSSFRIWRLFSVISIIGSLYACGKQGKFDVTEVKDYRIFVQTQDPKLQSEIISMVDQFNTKACAPVLSIVDAESDANSFMRFTKGLEQRDGKIGWGRWTRRTEQGQNSAFSNSRTAVTYRYGIDVEFDLGYFENRLSSDDESKREDLFKLFAHETGHGMQMGHDNEVSSLMYPDISGEKDMPAFFQKVRTYISNGVHPEWSSSQCAE